MEAGGLQGVFAMGPASPKEFENPLSTPDILAPVVAASGEGRFGFLTEFQGCET